MRLFLAKVNDINDRDVVKYIDFRGFECDHYFGGLHIEGACFSGFEKELREVVENNFDALETILTRDEFMKLFELDDRISALGYGIKKDSEKYLEGMAILDEYQNTIEKRLTSDENKRLFEKVVIDEKEFVKGKYNLTDDEIEFVFGNYGLEYQDRAIISAVYNDEFDFIEEEKFAFGYDKVPYFDDDAFLDDLLQNEYNIRLESGKIVTYAY